MAKKIMKTEWFKTNGFSENGVTYLVLGNSYPIKDELKNAGFKFSQLLRWHCDNCDFKLPEDCWYKEISFDELFSWSEDGESVFLREGTRDKLEYIFNPPQESNSDYQGEIGERLRNIPVFMRGIGGYDSAYGYKWVYTFEDVEGNVYSWFTTSQQPVSWENECVLTGTVKAHVEYKGIRTTQLSRCKLVMP